jgi:hypothetical protein
MAVEKQTLTYVLANGYEKTVALHPEILLDIVKWYNDSNSKNTYDLSDDKSVQSTLFKDTILAVRY